MIPSVPENFVFRHSERAYELIILSATQPRLGTRLPTMVATRVSEIPANAMRSSAPRRPSFGFGLLLFGLWFVFVALIGLSPRITDDAPRLRHGGLGTSGITWLVWTVTLLAAIGIDFTTARTVADPGPSAPALLAVAFVLALVSFLAYGIARVRTGTPSGRSGSSCSFQLAPSSDRQSSWPRRS